MRIPLTPPSPITRHVETPAAWPPRGVWGGCAVAVLSIAAVAVLRWCLAPYLGVAAPLLMFILAVAAAAYTGGWWAGALATLLSLLVGTYLFVQPLGQVTPETAADYLRILLFATVGTLVSYLYEQLHRTARRLRSQQSRLELEGNQRCSAEAELEYQRSLLEAVAENAQTGILMMDHQGRGLFANSAAEKITGFSRAELVGQVLHDLVHHSHPDGRPYPIEECPLDSALPQQAVVVGHEDMFIHKAGHFFPVRCNARPVMRNGQIDATIIEIWDISEQRAADTRLRQSESFYRQTLESMPGMTFTNTPEGACDFVSQQWSDFSGIPAEQLLGDGWSQLLHPDDRQRGWDAWRNAVEVSGSYDLEFRIRRHDGHYEWFKVQARAIRDLEGRIVRWLGTGLSIEGLKRAEHQLRESEDRWRQLLALLPVGVYACDADGNITFYNQAAAQLWGREPSPSDSEGRFCGALRLYRPDGTPLPKEETPVAAALGGGPPVRDGRVVIERPTGDRLHVSVNVDPLMEDGQLAGVIVAFADITERERVDDMLRQSEQRLAMALEAGQLGFWDWHLPSGHVLFGGRWAAMLGYALDEIEPNVRVWERLVHPDEKLEVMRTLQAHLDGRTEFYECEHRLLHKDGSWRWILDRGQVVERDSEGRPLRALGTHADITERKLAEVALRDADRMKDEFIATLAHELRNPLAPIRTGLELMKHASGDPQVLEEVRSLMERQTQLLVRLVDDLLEVSRITRGRLHLRKRRVELLEVVNAAVDSCRSLFSEAGQCFEMHLPEDAVWLDADPQRLAQVLANLLNNAGKYTPAGGHIWLEADCQPGELVIKIRDDGLGIPVEMQDRIFEMFTQLEQVQDQGYSGLGVGLTLVKSLVEMHGGSVEVFSAGRQQGSEFTVRLPVAAGCSQSGEEPRETPAAGVMAFPSEPRRVLVVDDNHAAQLMLRKMVQLLGYEVQTAADGVEAVQAAEQFRPDVVLMDVGMPRMDGHEAARRIREQPWGQSMTLIALTGWGQEKDKRLASEAGFDHHLVKPAEPAELQRLLAEAAVLP
jgi:PAS domain S-box-containing protein